MSEIRHTDAVPGRSGGRADLRQTLSLDDKIRLLTGTDNWHSAALPQIGLRSMAFSDGPAGVRGVALDERNPSASLPCPSALGATWDPGLIERLAFELGTEARSKGIDILLAPTVNIMRTPLGGRGFESFGEDPVLVAAAAAAFVTGVQAAGVACAVKHLVCNDSETGRWTYDARIDEDVLREVYLAPFEAVSTRAGLVMTGYNSVNGHSMTENSRLLTAVLKDEWGFDGVVLSDWHAARSTAATALAGLDLVMPGPDGPWGARLRDAVRAGEVSEADVDEKVTRILRLARRVGALNPGTVGDGLPDSGLPVSSGRGFPDPGGDGRSPRLADPGLLREAVAASFTLLANDGTLPLRDGQRLALLGPNAVDPVIQGGGSATVNPVAVSTLAGELSARAPGRVTVAPGCVTWSLVPSPEPSSLTDPVTGEAGIRIEFRSPDGALLAAEHRTATMFTWWDGLPDGIGWGGQGTIALRARYVTDAGGPHVIGAGGVGRLTLRVAGTVVASGSTGVPADPVEAMVRPGEIRARASLPAGQQTEVEVELLPENWGQGPVAIRLGITPEPDSAALLAAAVTAARDADVAVVVAGPGPATESEGFDRPGLALPAGQDELIRQVAAVNPRTVVIVNAGMPVLMPWADQVAAIGYAWLPGQAMGEGLADVLSGRAEPGGRLPVTIPRSEEDCPVLHAVPEEGELRYSEGLLIGYRGYDRAGTEPLFPFGHGLGYTRWSYESARVVPAATASADGTGLPAGAPVTGTGDNVAVEVAVRNTGPRPGREVIQAYLESPAAPANRPLRTLAAFTSLTCPPATTAVARLLIPRRAFARFDPAAGGWTYPDQLFILRIGRSSRDLRLSVAIRPSRTG
jgi:beta-glucosidase